jgi:hypothetical protein
MPCVSLGFVTFGCESKTDVKAQADIQQATSAVSALFQSRASSATVNISPENYMSIENYGTMPCSMSITQKISGDFKVVQSQDMNMAGDVAAKLAQTMNSQIDQMNTAQQSALAGALKASTTTEVKQKMTAHISNSVTQSSVTNALTSMTPRNNLVIKNYGILCLENVEQSMMLDIAASQVIQDTVTALMKIDEVQAAASAVTQEQETENKGALDSISDAISSFGLFAIIGVIAFVVLVGLWLKYGSSSLAAITGASEETSVSGGAGSDRTIRKGVYSSSQVAQMRQSVRRRSTPA